MYGYQPPEPESEGSWREVFTITRVAFEVLAGPLFAILYAMTVFVLTLWTLFTSPILVIIPIAMAALGIWWLIRRDKKAHAEALADVESRGRRNV